MIPQCNLQCLEHRGRSINIEYVNIKHRIRSWGIKRNMDSVTKIIIEGVRRGSKLRTQQ